MVASPFANVNDERVLNDTSTDLEDLVGLKSQLFQLGHAPENISYSLLEEMSLHVPELPDELDFLGVHQDGDNLLRY